MKKTIKDYELNGKKVIIRCDLNVPIKDGLITDDTRIKSSLKTIKYAISKGAKVILLSHLGKIKTPADLEKNDLSIVKIKLEELLNQDVVFSSTTHGKELEEKINNLKNGEILLVQNTRYEDLDGKKESSCNEELSQYWASLGDIFINDAYGTSHRTHASNVGIASHLKNGLGFLVEDEITKIDKILQEDTHPFVVIMGGAKVSDKITVIENLIKKCDYLLVGGGMAYTFLKAQNINVGKSLVDEESLDFCRKILKEYKDKIILPIDHLVSTGTEDNNFKEKSIYDTKTNEMGLDIGKKTICNFQNYLKNARRVIINGPLGYFENETYATGTASIYQFLTDNHIKTLVGGGDSAASVNKLSRSELFYHISTGGGATLKYLEGTTLPGISVINEQEK